MPSSGKAATGARRPERHSLVVPAVSGAGDGAVQRDEGQGALPAAGAGHRGGTSCRRSWRPRGNFRLPLCTSGAWSQSLVLRWSQPLLVVPNRPITRNLHKSFQPQTCGMRQWESSCLTYLLGSVPSTQEKEFLPQTGIHRQPPGRPSPGLARRAG